MVDNTVQYMLSTIDNPYNPFTDYDSWYAWDEAAGYHTTSYLARVVITSDDLSGPDVMNDINSAIDEIVAENINGMYLRVREPSPLSTVD